MKSKLNTYLNFKNLHLIISLSIVIPTAFIYGVFTYSILPERLDIQVETIDLANFFRAIMCLYIGVAVVWVLGIIKPKFWNTATQLLILFMTTLAIGRSISIIVDGIPSNGYIFGVLAEFVLAIYGVFQLRKYGLEQAYKL